MTLKLIKTKSSSLPPHREAAAETKLTALSICNE